MKEMTKTVYVADDGTEFDNAIDAIRHDNTAEFQYHYDQGHITTLYVEEYAVDGEALAIWALENKNALLKLLA